MTEKQLKANLLFELQKAGKRSSSYPLRLDNIAFIENLKRKKLCYSKVEKEIVFWETENERITIRYPGKESNPTRKNPRPWDFRPKLFYNATKTYEKDLSFGGIWEILEDIYNKTKPENRIYISAVAVLIYRMAFMLDFTKKVKHKTKEVIINYSKTVPKFGKEKEIEIELFYDYTPNMEVINLIQEKLGNFGNMTLLAFLHYNHLLAFNEDCKYYYRNKLKAKKEKLKTIPWIDDIGRINNLLTHIAILSHYFGNISVANLVYGVILKRGVCPCTEKEIKIVCDGFIKTENDEKPASLFD